MNEINIGIRMHDTPAAPLQERLAQIKAQGLSCVHLALSKVFPEMEIIPQKLTPGFASCLKKEFVKADVDIAVLGCYLNLLNPDAQQLAQIKNTYKAHIRFAAQLGCGMVATETGTPNENYSPDARTRDADTLAAFIRQLKEIVGYAEKMGVIVAIEPVAIHSVYDAQTAQRVLKEVDSPNLQILFDPVNILDAENYTQRDALIAQMLDAVGEDIAAIHLKDFVIENNHLKSVPLGQGMMDYQPLFTYLKQNKPHLYATLEDAMPQDVPQALQTISSLNL